MLRHFTCKLVFTKFIKLRIRKEKKVRLMQEQGIESHFKPAKGSWRMSLLDKC